jgi:hypothetical protein
MRHYFGRLGASSDLSGGYVILPCGARLATFGVSEFDPSLATDLDLVTIRFIEMSNAIIVRNYSPTEGRGW